MIVWDCRLISTVAVFTSVCYHRNTVGLVYYAVFLVMQLCEFYRNRTIKNRKINLRITYIVQ